MLQVNKAPQSEQELAQMPAIYTKFIEDKVLSEQEANESTRESKHRQGSSSERKMTERDIK